jgi:hypothetical protein
MLRKQIDRWLFEEYRTDVLSLALFRIFFGAYVLVVELPTALWTLPQAAFSPPVSFLALFTHFPPRGLVLLLNAATMACACMLLIGWRTVLASFGLAVGLLLVQTFRFADGKIDEGMAMFVALLLARSGWGAVISVDERRSAGVERSPHQPWLTAILALVIGFALFTAGSAKVHGSWLSPGALGTRYHLFWDYYVFGRKMPLATWCFQHLPSWAWKLLDWPTVLWEVGFVATVFRRRWCWLACAFGTLFHFGVWLLFDIQVATNVVAYGALVTWAPLWPAGAERLRQWVRGLSPAASMGLCAVPFVFAAIWLFAVSADLRDELSIDVAKAVIAVGLVVGLGHLVTRARATLLRARS